MKSSQNNETREPCTAQEWNEQVYAAKKQWHREQAQLPIKEKMRIML